VSVAALTCSFAAGLVVPIPKLPLESIRIDSAPPSEKAIVSAAGKKIPVLVSPVVVMAGSAAVPAEKVATPVADNVVNAPVVGVVAPTVPLRGPENPAAVKIVPLKVKLAESVSSPLVVENTTRPEVKPVLVMEENTPAPEMLDTLMKSVPFQAQTADSPLMMVTPVVGPAPRSTMLWVLELLLMTMYALD